MSASVCTLDTSRCEQGEQQAWVKGTANAVIFVGAVMGQLGMGFLGDYLSRNTALAVTLSLSPIAALLSVVASVGSPTTVYTVIIICRFVIGKAVPFISPQMPAIHRAGLQHPAHRSVCLSVAVPESKIPAAAGLLRAGVLPGAAAVSVHLKGHDSNGLPALFASIFHLFVLIL
jgi:hypothetical protein